MPCWEFFDAAAARVPRRRCCRRRSTARLSIEAGVTLGWKRWVGDRGGSIGLDRFGASAPGEIVMRELGFTVEHVVRYAKDLSK